MTSPLWNKNNNGNITFCIVMIPSCVSLSADILKISNPSPSTILYSISALTPISASIALILATTDATGKDSGTLYW